MEPASKNSANSYLEYGKKCHRIINIPIMANVRTNCHTKNISISGNKRRSGESKKTTEETLDRISYLDILLTKQDEVIITDTHYKPTHTHQYLHFNSCNPRHTKRTIPDNLAR